MSASAPGERAGITARLAHARRGDAFAAVATFVVLAAAVGTVAVFAIKPLHGWDEAGHFLNVERFSHGHLRYDKVTSADGKEHRGWWFDNDVVAATARWSPGTALEEVHNVAPRAGQTFVEVPRSSYPATAYASAIPALWLARVTGFAPHGQLLAARFAALLAYVLIVAFAIAIVPARRYLFVMLGLWPVCIVQAATISADTLAIALGFLVVASAWRLATTETVTRVDVIVAVLTMLALAAVKPPSVILGGCYLVAAWRRPALRRVLAVGLLVTAALFAAVSLLLQGDYKDQTAPVLTKYGSLVFRVDPPAQFRFMMEHPVRMVRVSARTVRVWGPEIARGVVADPPGAPYRFPDWARIVCLLLTVGGVLSVTHERGPPRLLRLALGVAALIAMLAAALLLYAGSNPVGHYEIFGVQGRYLVPALPAFLVAVAPTWSANRLTPRGLRAIQIGAATAVAAITLYGLHLERHV